MYSIVSISMRSDDRDGRRTSFFFHLNNQTSVVLMKYEVLVFKVFSSGLHKLSHFNSQISTLGFTCCCKLLEAKKFSRKPG